MTLLDWAFIAAGNSLVIAAMASDSNANRMVVAVRALGSLCVLHCEVLFRA